MIIGQDEIMFGSDPKVNDTLSKLEVDKGYSCFCPLCQELGFGRVLTADELMKQMANKGTYRYVQTPNETLKTYQTFSSQNYHFLCTSTLGQTSRGFGIASK